MRQIVSFDKLKLTNNLLDDNGHVSHGGTAWWRHLELMGHRNMGGSTALQNPKQMSFPCRGCQH